MERRRTDRKALLEHTLTALWYFCAHSQRLITGNVSCHDIFQLRNTLDNSPSSFSGTEVPCANPVNQIPLFVTKEVLSQHELFFGLLYAAVNRTQRGVLRYLERAESRESDVWAQQDYRVAQVILILADEGAGNPYSKAFRQLFGKNAHEVRFWWRDREKLFAVSQIANSPTPLCHPDVGQSLPDELVPDYDYSRRSK